MESMQHLMKYYDFTLHPSPKTNTIYWGKQDKRNPNQLYIGKIEYDYDDEDSRRLAPVYRSVRQGDRLLDMHQISDALQVYKSAEAQLQTGTVPRDLVIDVWGGLAAALVRLDEIERAYQYAEKAWGYLQQELYESDWSWGRSALYLYDVFNQMGDSRAAAVLEFAFAELHAMSSATESDVCREKIFAQTPEHREIVALYSIIHADTPVAT